MLMENFNVNDVVSIMINYGDYSHIRNGVITKIENGKYLVEYVFWGPYDDDTKKYKQWCTEDELTLVTNDNIIFDTLKKHNNLLFIP